MPLMCPKRSRCCRVESAAVQSWDVKEIEVPEGTRRAAALETVDGARAIIIRLAPGEELGDHPVRERAWLVVVEGSARVEAGRDIVEAGSGTLLTFEPDKHHKVSSVSGARVVMILFLLASGRPLPVLARRRSSQHLAGQTEHSRSVEAFAELECCPCSLYPAVRRTRAGATQRVHIAATVDERIGRL